MSTVKVPTPAYCKHRDPSVKPFGTFVILTPGENGVSVALVVCRTCFLKGTMALAELELDPSITVVDPS